MLIISAGLYSPVIALIIAIFVVSITDVPTSKLTSLLFLTLSFAVAGAATTLLMTIAWMYWYEYSTGFSAGNAPLGWIFFYGPLGAAIGQLCALRVWWLKNRRRANPGNPTGPVK